LRAEQNDTLLNATIARHPEIHGIGEGGLRSGVTHRLDRGTSGAVLFALSDPQWHRLRDAFTQHAIRKTYRALVRGKLQGSDCDTRPLTVRQHHPARVAVTTKGARGARQCTLAWRAIETFRQPETGVDVTLLEVQLETGFLHQVRVMLAHRGHPILGDTVYGDATTAGAAPRPMLHAYALAHKEVRGVCPLPADFQQMVGAARDERARRRG